MNPEIERLVVAYDDAVNRRDGDAADEAEYGLNRILASAGALSPETAVNARNSLGEVRAYWANLRKRRIESEAVPAVL